MNATRAGARRVRVLGLAAMIGVTAVAVRPTNAGGPSESGQAKSGLRVYIDPETGKLAGPPAGVESVPTTQAGRREADTLIETPSGGPAGGVMVNTKGRYHADVMAATDAGGKATVRCAPHRPDHHE